MKSQFHFFRFISWNATWISTKHNFNWQKWYKSRYLKNFITLYNLKHWKIRVILYKFGQNYSKVIYGLAKRMPTKPQNEEGFPVFETLTISIVSRSEYQLWSYICPFDFVRYFYSANSLSITLRCNWRWSTVRSADTDKLLWQKFCCMRPDSLEQSAC